MIKRKNEMNSTIKVNMRGGDGQAVITDVLSKGEYDGHSRLVATITLEKGCSIGEHIHENEEEIFYIISGKALYNDDGNNVELLPGDSCICKNGQKHAISNAGDETLVFFAVIQTL